MTAATTFSYESLESALVDAVESVNLIDAAIDRLIVYLNKRKVRRAEEKVAELERQSKRYDAARKTLDAQSSALSRRIAEVQKNRHFKSDDWRTLGISYLLRNFILSFKEDSLRARQRRCRSAIEEIDAHNSSIRGKIPKLKQRVEAMKQQENPSLLARILRWVKLIVNIVALVTKVLAGKAIGALFAIHGTIKSAVTLDTSPLTLAYAPATGTGVSLDYPLPKFDYTKPLGLPKPEPTKFDYTKYLDLPKPEPTKFDYTKYLDLPKPEPTKFDYTKYLDLTK